MVRYSLVRATQTYAYAQPYSTTVGEAVTLTADVAAAGAGEALTGTVDFYLDGTLLATEAVGQDGAAAHTTRDITLGSHLLTAVYSGDSLYQTSTSNPFGIEIGQGPQVITVTAPAPATAVVGGPGYAPAATGGPSGNPVTFAIDPASTAVCALDGVGEVSFIGAGTCTVLSDQAGSTDYAAAEQVRQDVTVEPGEQAITFTSAAPSSAVVDGPGYTPTATGGPSGNPVSFTIDPASTAVCAVTGQEVTFTAAGTCTLNADQAGTDDYVPAGQAAQQNIAVGAGAQAVTFTSAAPSDAVVDGARYTPTATGGPSGNPVTFTIDPASATVCTLTGDEVTFTAAGTCTLNADQAGNADYTAAAAAQQSIPVGPGQQSITFTSSAPTEAAVGASYTLTAGGGASGAPVLFTIDPGSEAVCTITGGTVTFTGVGTCVVNADQAATANYSAAPQAQQRIVVSPTAAAPAPPSTDGPSLDGPRESSPAPLVPGQADRATALARTGSPVQTLAAYG